MAAVPPRPSLFPYTTLFRSPFKLPGGGTVSVPMMRQRTMLKLLETPAFEAVEMPYKGEELSMLLFLPKETSRDRKSTRLNSSHSQSSYAVFCLKKKRSRRCP